VGKADRGSLIKSRDACRSRMAWVASERAKGRTWASIGREMGISAGRARELGLRHAKYAGAEGTIKELSTRLFNCLRNRAIALPDNATRSDVERVMPFIRENWHRQPRTWTSMRNFGHECLIELEAWLQQGAAASDRR
jgi:hypothetical protein